jgi:uncharacterized protein YdiU (UPF0061 family)
MPVSPSYSPDPRFMTLGPEFADPVAPAEFPRADLRFRNDRWATRIGLETLSPEEWTGAFARFEPLPDNQPHPLALRYHGHQFQSYNPEIGDGRGFLYAQLREQDSGRLLDLGTKGSGLTPYSRFGDGRLTLKGGVREVLATQMLEALGVPTSKSFALIETGEALLRNDEPSPTRSAVLTRLSYSNIRFGTFQRHAYFERTDLIAELIDHVIALYYPEVETTEDGDRAGALLAAVVQRAAKLVARWMAAGFVHGVLNTDNMNINGESFDYGPYRFLPYNDPEFTAAYFDQTGLYAFGRQPAAVFWNLQQLAACLQPLADPDHLVAALNGFGAAYRQSLCEAMLTRLGVESAGAEADAALASAAFGVLQAGAPALGWEPFFFDWFGGEASSARALAGERKAIYRGEAFDAFRARLSDHAPHRPERLASPYFAQPGPEALLYDEIEAIWSAIADRDDWAPFNAKLAAIDRARAAMDVAREVPFGASAPI